MKESRHYGGVRSWSASMEGTVTGPGTVKRFARSAQGSGLGTRVSNRMASKGTRSRGLEEVPNKAPASKSATPANGMICRPFSTICFFRGKRVSRVQHIDEIAAGKGRGTITAN